MTDNSDRCPCGHAAVSEHDEWRGCYLCLCERGPFQAADAALLAAVKGGQGREPEEIADTGSALVGCAGWAALLFAAFVAWVIVESIGGAK